MAEIYSTEARRLQAPHHELHVPTFFDVELANIVWKKRRRGELTRPEADATVIRHREAALLTPAFDLAEQYQRTVYDCLYLALALRENSQLVTADDRFVNSLAGSVHGAAICHVQNTP